MSSTLEDLKKAWPTAARWRQDEFGFTAVVGLGVTLSVFTRGSDTDYWTAELSGEVVAETGAENPVRAARKLRTKLKRLVIFEE
jgi:hypothetical protein